MIIHWCTKVSDYDDDYLHKNARAKQDALDYIMPILRKKVESKHLVETNGMYSFEIDTKELFGE